MHRAAGGAVDDEAEVELPGHLQAFLDEDARDDAPLGPGLVGDQRHAEHVPRRCARPRRGSSRA